MSTSTTLNTKIFTDLPHPIATAWDRVLRCTSSADQVRQIKALLDVYLRYTSGILLAAYVREEPKDAIESMLPSLSGPSNGHYCGLIREMLRYFREIQTERDAPHFFNHAIDWYWEEQSRKPKQSKEAKRLDQLITFRNDDSHGIVRTEQELKQEISDVLQEVQQLLYRSKWLSGYGLFRVTEGRRRRGGGEEGNVHAYKGKVLALPKQSIWSSILYPEVMYLSSPNGTQILEVDPFLISELIGRKEELLLWVSTPKQKRIDLRNDNTGYEAKKMPLLGDSNVQWKEWLDSRTHLEPIQSNEYPQDFLDPHFQDVGSVIDDHFKIIRHLGEGGMATVYEVYDLVMEENLALKILHLEQVDTKIKDRTKKEFKFMQNLNHPNILPVKSIDFLSDGRIAIGMPLMEGTLKDYLEDSTITEEQVLYWGRDLLSALDYLHDRSQPIYHRDMKPSNVLYDSEGQVYLADFGIARQEGDVRITRTAEQMGSLPYMAPETIRGAEADKSTDRYSLAVALHELLTGKLPKKVGEGVEGHLGDVLRRLGSIEPEERLTVSVEDFDEPIVSEEVSDPDQDIQMDLDAFPSGLELSGESVSDVVDHQEDKDDEILNEEQSQNPQTSDSVEASEVVESEGTEAEESPPSVDDADLDFELDKLSDDIDAHLDDTQQESVDSNFNEPVQSQTSELAPLQAESFWAKSHVPWLVIAPIVGYRLIEILAIYLQHPIPWKITAMGLTIPSYPSANILPRVLYLSESQKSFYGLDGGTLFLYIGLTIAFTFVFKVVLNKFTKGAIGLILLVGMLDLWGVLQVSEGAMQVWKPSSPPPSGMSNVTYDINWLRTFMINPNIFPYPWFIYSLIALRTGFYVFICHKIGQAVSSKKTEA